jgi:hypothetical protein
VPAKDVVAGLNGATLLVAMVKPPLAIENAGRSRPFSIDVLLMGTNDLCPSWAYPASSTAARGGRDRLPWSCVPSTASGQDSAGYTGRIAKRYIARGMRFIWRAMISAC